MIWLVLTGCWLSGFVCGVTAIWWAEAINESRRRDVPKAPNRNGTDSITNNDILDMGRHTYAP